MLVKLITLPFKMVLGLLRGILGFVSNRVIGTIFGAIFGLLLGKSHLHIRLFSGRRKLIAHR
jgi:hypothetical protein